MSFVLVLYALFWQSATVGVGSPGPPIVVSEWIVHEQLATQNGRVRLLMFVDLDADTRHAEWQRMKGLAELLRDRGVVLVICTAPPEAAREYHQTHQGDWPDNLALARDAADRTRRAYCDPVGVAYLPYLFVVDARGMLAWHGHPQSPPTDEIVQALIDGRYDADRARALVRAERTADRLQAMFEQAFALQRWDVALRLVDELLTTDAPKPQLLRHKLALLLGPLRRVQEAERLVTAVLDRYGGDAKLLNTLAWDLLNQPQAFRRSPRVAVELARAALAAAAKTDAPVLDTYALAMYRIGAIDEAVARQRQAVEHASDTERPAYADTLAFYERCAALRADIPRTTTLPR